MLTSKASASATLETATSLASQPTTTKGLLTTSLTTTPSTTFQNRATGNGLQANYFSGPDFQNLKLSRVDTAVNFDWGKGSPAAAVGSDHFSVRWTGQIASKYSETYTFYTKADDGVRLWVNGKLLINDWTDHSVKEDQGKIRLEAGKKYDIKLEYYENSGKAVSKLLWSSASQSKQIVPQSQLFSSGQLSQNPGSQPVSDQPAAIPGSQPATQNPSSTPLTKSTSIIGTNLNGVTDYTTEWPFVDAFKVARPWISQRPGAAFGEGGKLNLTAEGWVASLEPGQTAETVIYDNGSHYPAGQYTLLYEGEGNFEFGFNSAKIVSQTPGRMVLDITPQETGIWLKITGVNAANPLRNMHLIMPGFENTYEQQPFHPLFLERLSKFTTLRFMDWQNTNNSDVKEWSDRPLTSSPTQGTLRGAALEYMISLSNTLHIDPWFSIPHQASDDYVRQFALLVRDRLDPSLKVHIEYSNEVWNPQFEQAGYARDQGKALGLADDDFLAQLRYYSQRSVEIFKIWEGVFGGHDRLVRVMASQAVNTYVGEQELSWKDAYKQTDEYAIAPYFYTDDLLDPAKVNETLRKTPDQIIDELLNQIHTQIRQVDTENAALAKSFGVTLAAYEAGPHLYSYQFGAQTDQVTELFNSVNRNPRMRDVYKEYLNEWKQVGGGEFNQFTDVSMYTKYGQWGALEYEDQDINTAPKYLGLMDFIAANSR